MQQVAKALASDKKKAGFKNKKAQRKEKKGQAFPLPREAPNDFSMMKQFKEK